MDRRLDLQPGTRRLAAALVLFGAALDGCMPAPSPHVTYTPQGLSWPRSSWDAPAVDPRELTVRSEDDRAFSLSVVVIGEDAAAFTIDESSANLPPSGSFQFLVQALPGAPDSLPIGNELESLLGAELLLLIPFGGDDTSTELRVPLSAARSCDFDDDGALALRCGGADCDELDAGRFPGHPEICDGLDQDCDGLPEPTTDADGDGALFCDDCDDDEPTRFPDNQESCDGLDNDCSGEPGEGEWDLDEDGAPFCLDCDDTRTQVFPGAPELCDGLDDDCNGLVSGEGDGDGDGSLRCADCDDGDPLQDPGGPELCDGRDNNCDGEADADPAGEVDEDLDESLSCVDCEDDDPMNSPAYPEYCDGLDNDCSGSPDVDAAGEVDDDGDGWFSCEDCDDGNGLAWPGGVELCDGFDGDCDGDADEDARRVPQDFGTIQAALDASQGGDVVCVSPGTYLENLDFGGVSAQLIGWAGAGQTVIDGGGLTTTIFLVSGEGPGTRIEGVTVTGGSGGLVPGIGQTAGGIDVRFGVVEIVEVVIEGNVAEVGAGGMHLYSSTATLESVLLSNNAGAAGAVSVSGSIVVGTRLTVHGTSGGTNSAFEVGGGSNITLDRVIIRDNGPGVSGPFIMLGSALTLTNSLIRGNFGADYGGGMRLDNSTATLTNVAFYGNGASILGGGMFATGSTVTLAHCAFVGNVTGFTGGALRLWDSNMLVTNCDFSDNVAGVAGAAIYVPSGALPTITNSNFWNNGPNSTFSAWSGYQSPVGTNGIVALDPAYEDVAATDPAAWDLHLGVSSSLIDLGDPLVFDPDGSRSDIGVYSGPGAAAFDLDGDGFPSWWQPGPYLSSYPALGLDCGDEDASVQPALGLCP